MIFGTGGYYENKKDCIEGEIIAFIDNYKTGLKQSIPIITPKQIFEYNYDFIYVMSVHFVEMVYQLLDLGVRADKIKIGVNLEKKNSIETYLFRNNGRVICTKDNKVAYSVGNTVIAVKTYDELYNVCEIFSDIVKTYNYFFDSEKDEIVIDVGMNIGAASVYFANRDNVKAVYAYEPFPKTFELAAYNIEKNSKAAEKVIMKNAGWGKENETKVLDYCSNMTCGLATNSEDTQNAVSMYKKMGLINASEEYSKESINIVSAVQELQKIVEHSNGRQIVMKIDCEGAEYEIFSELDKFGLVRNINVIMLEWHYKGSDMIEEILKKNNFSYFSFGKNENLGTIYAVKREAL